MKRIIYCLVIISMFCVSCTNEWDKFIPKSTFDAPFPKPNKDLTKILGKKLYIKRGKDTTKFNITATDKLNLITDKNGDTIFCGTVSKFRGLYYFSQQLNDTAYLIYAVKKVGDLLYGLNAPWFEGIQIDKRIEKGEYKELVKYISIDGKVIRIHPEKHSMKKMYAEVMDSIPPDTILAVPGNMSTPAVMDTTNITQQIDPDDFEMFSKVYPNPAKDEVNIDLQEKQEVKYMISDMTGKTIVYGDLHDTTNKIDVSKLPAGIYIITLVKTGSNEEESVKIIKQD